MNEIKHPPETVFYVARNANGSVLHEGATEPNQVTTSGQPTLDQADSVNGQLEKLAPYTSSFPPMPEIGEELQAGEIYSFYNVLYRVRQSHARTIYPPDETPALFLWYRSGPQIDWVVNEQVMVGQIRTDGGIKYKCIQSHVTQDGWEPENVPALWAAVEDPQPEIPEWVQPIGAHDAYAIGAKVTHNSKTWESTAAANVWEPGVYGWIEA